MYKLGTEEFPILYEDNHLIVVVKPSSLASCPDESGDESAFSLIEDYLKETYHKPGKAFVGIVHRLDRPTGGVMVFTKTSKAASRLCEQMRSGDFDKRYLTVLVGTPEPESGKLENYLKKNTVNNVVYISTAATDGAKYAALDYRVEATADGLALTEIKLHTGRSHQIRVQTAYISHPVYGDMRYGGERAKKGKLALFAYSLCFTHPVTRERMRFVAEPPADENPWNKFDFSQILRRARGL